MTLFCKKACKPGDFQCNNSVCIKGEFRCDGFFHCNDRSDEANCGPRSMN